MQLQASITTCICDEWWDETERLIKRKNKKGNDKIQPKFALGYVHDDSTTSEDEGVNDPRRVMCHMTSVTSNQPEECSTFGEECDNPYLISYQLRSFYVAANARKGMRDERYLLSRVAEALNVGEQGEVLDAAPAPQQLEDGVQLTIDELVEINLRTEDDPRPTFVSASLTPKERENYR
jgi:hypothetical protein